MTAASERECRGGALSSGKCATLIPIGSACSPATGSATHIIDCAAGGACNSATGLCQAVGKTGDSCASVACGPFLSCFAGVCGTASKPSQSCRLSSDPKLNIPCELDNYCAVNTDGAGSCAPVQKAGFACNDSSDCAYGLYCSGASTAYRKQGKCLSPLADSSSCDSDYQCLSGFCTGNACVSPLAAGAACTRDSACQSGICDGSTCAAFCTEN